MPKKKVTEGKVDVKSLSLADLYALYQYVQVAHNGLSFNAKNVSLVVVSERLKEVEVELYMRAYGQNPYVATTTTTVEGKKPEEVLAKLPSIKPTLLGDKTGVSVLPPEGKVEEAPKTEAQPRSKKNFVVAKGDLKEEGVVKASDPHFVVAKKEEK